MGAVQDFYNKMYRIENKTLHHDGILGWLYKKLNKYEIHRIDLAVSLLPPGNRLLDLGTGNGEILKRTRIKKYKEVYGVDISSKNLEYARKNLLSGKDNNNNTHLIEGDIDEKLPFDDNYFDTVTVLAVLEHIFDPYFVVKEINRVLENGGKVIIGVPNIAWLPHRLNLLLGKLPKTADEEGWDGGHLHYFTFEALKQLLRKSGFKVIKTTSSGIFVPIKNIFPSLLNGDIVVVAEKV